MMVFRIQFLLIVLLTAAPSDAQRIEYVRLTRDVIEERLHRFGPRNPDRENNLCKMFEEAGCNDRLLVEQKVKGSRLPNVVCTLEGKTDSVIIVGAHYDTVPNSKGVVDNWSGAALLPSLFQSLRLNPMEHTFVFVGFTDEETGLVGSDFYAKKLTREEITKTRAMVNLDTLGLSSTKVWFSHSDKRLSELLASLANALKLPLGFVNVEQVGTTDSESFARRKIPSIAIHSVTQVTLPILHSAKDNLDAVRLDDYYDTYRLLAAYLVFLDTALP